MAVQLHGPRHLPPAEEVCDGPYELKELQAPVLRGWALRAFGRLYETPLGRLLYPMLATQSGITQVLQGIRIPEPPLFGPDLSPVSSEPEAHAAPLELGCPADAKAVPVDGADGDNGPTCDATPPALARALQSGLLPHLRQLEALLKQGTPAQPSAAADGAAVEVGADGSGGAPPAPCSFTGSATVLDYALAYRTGSVTPSQVAERIIAFVEEGQARARAGQRGGGGGAPPPPPPLGWFVEGGWRPELIREAAAESTRRFASGRPRSLLEGVPYAVKDLADALPYPTTAGTTFVAEGRRVTSDAPYVATLRAMGALLLGKTSLHEIGLGITGLNPHARATALNPYAAAAATSSAASSSAPGGGGGGGGARHCHHTGGSSSGSASVLAAGLCPIAIGSDGGGSIRIPSSFCGLVGLKPSAGRVGAAGLVEIDCSVATMGPMAGCAQDAALLHALMCLEGPLATTAAAEAAAAEAAVAAPGAQGGDASEDGRDTVQAHPPTAAAAAAQAPPSPWPHTPLSPFSPLAPPPGPHPGLPLLPSPWPLPGLYGSGGGSGAGGAGDAREGGLAASWQPLAGLRIGVYEEWFAHAAPAVVSACRAALAALERCGAVVQRVAIPELEALRVAHTVTIVSEMLHNFRARFDSPPLRSAFNGDVRLALANAAFWRPADYIQAQRIRARANTHFRRALSQVHVIATPTTPIPAPRIHPAALAGGESNLRQVSVVMRFMVAANMLGLPAVSVPVGLLPAEEDAQAAAAGRQPAAAAAVRQTAAAAERQQQQQQPAAAGQTAAAAAGPPGAVLLPAGLQLIGRPLQEATLLRAAAVLEAELARERREAATAVAAPGGGGNGTVDGGASCPPPLHLNPLTGQRRGL